MRHVELDSQMSFDFVPMSTNTDTFFNNLERAANAVRSSTLYLVYADITRTAEKDSETGRKGMRAEQVVRMAMIKQLYGLSYRELQMRVDDSLRLRQFAGYNYTKVHGFKTLQANIKAVSEETWRQINRDIVKFGLKMKLDSLDQLRIDTTGIESDIHHPTDSSLLWDGIRVLTRMMQQAGNIFGVSFSFHNRSRVSKKLFFKIVNTKKTDFKQKLYGQLLDFARETCGYAKNAAKALRGIKTASDDTIDAAKRCAKEMEEFRELTLAVIRQAKRRVIKGEKVPAEEKVVSIFEPHTAILEKGDRETVFGHKTCFTIGRRLIFDADVSEEGNPNDSTLLPDALTRHKKNYGKVPDDLATDGGFASKENALFAKRLGVKHICFSKGVGKDTEELLATGKTRNLLLRFRAGVEGVISGAKRGVNLVRAMWRGLEGFCKYVMSAVCAYNLRMIAMNLKA